MKRTLLLVALALAFFSCKKSSNVKPQDNLTGTWILSSMILNGQVITAADYPCIANDSLLFNSSNNVTVRWYDANTCWINPAHTESFSADDNVIPFTRNGDKLHFSAVSINSNGGYGAITNNNGQFQLTILDTISGDAGTTYFSKTFLKH